MSSDSCSGFLKVPCSIHDTNVENYESNVQYSLMLLDVSVAKHTAEMYTDTNDWVEQLLIATRIE